MIPDKVWLAGRATRYRFFTLLPRKPTLLKKLERDKKSAMFDDFAKLDTFTHRHGVIVRFERIDISADTCSLYVLTATVLYVCVCDSCTCTFRSKNFDGFKSSLLDYFVQAKICNLSAQPEKSKSANPTMK